MRLVWVSLYCNGIPTSSWDWFSALTLKCCFIINRHLVTVHSTSRGMLSSLAIRPAQRTDTGVYACNAKNKHGFADMSMWLTVLGRHYFSSWQRKKCKQSVIISHIFQIIFSIVAILKFEIEHPGLCLYKMNHWFGQIKNKCVLGNGSEKIT